MTADRHTATHESRDAQRVRGDLVPMSSDAVQDQGTLVATRDRDQIREWAIERKAEPATGIETPTGSATVDVHDGGSAIRFNFPAAAPFRPISWDEWFTLFERDDLVFVYEPAEGAAGSYGRRGPTYYRLMPATAWTGTLIASRSRTPMR